MLLPLLYGFGLIGASAWYEAQARKMSSGASASGLSFATHEPTDTNMGPPSQTITYCKEEESYIEELVEMAEKEYGPKGVVFSDDGRVSFGDEPGAYVQGWVWINVRANRDTEKFLEMLNEKSEILEIARKEWQTYGEIEIDEGARLSIEDDGTYVEAWVWVYHDELGCQEED